MEQFMQTKVIITGGGEARDPQHHVFMNLLLSTKNRPPTVPKSSNIRDITAYSILMQPGHVIPLDFPEKPLPALSSCQTSQPQRDFACLHRD